jgi:hypothetical protein
MEDRREHQQLKLALHDDTCTYLARTRQQGGGGGQENYRSAFPVIRVV